MGVLTSKAIDMMASGIVLLASITLLIVGVPRFAAEVVMAVGTPIYDLRNAAEKVNDVERAALEESRSQAIRLINHPVPVTNHELIAALLD